MFTKIIKNIYLYTHLRNSTTKGIEFDTLRFKPDALSLSHPQVHIYVLYIAVIYCKKFKQRCVKRCQKISILKNIYCQFSTPVMNAVFAKDLKK